MAVRRHIRIAFLLAVMGALSLNAGDKVQIRGSTSVELPKPKTSLEDLRQFKIPEGPSGQGEYQSGISAGTPVNNAPQPDKRLLELIDKQKNWIFMNPYEENYDAKTEEFLKGEKASGLYDHPMMKGENKTLLEKFLNDKGSERDDDPESIDRKDAARDFHQDMMKERKELGQEKAFSPVNNRLESGISLDQKPSLFGDRTLFDKGSQKTIFSSGNALMGGADRSLAREDLRKERDARDADIVRMLQPRTTPSGAPIGSLAPAGGTIAGPVFNSGFNPVGANPFAGGRRDSAPATIGTGRNGPIFSSGSSPANIPARAGFDFGAKTAPSTSSAFAPSRVAPAPAPRASGNAAAFSLPFPQRKF